MSNNSMEPKLFVGIGSSMGGLSALEGLISALPNDSGMAFFVVQHLSSDYVSKLDHMLAKHTSMSVNFATHGQSIESNCVYITPPGQQMTVSEGRIQILPIKIDDKVPPRTIDNCFHSLAKEAKERSVGIVLSGAGTDSLEGIEYIHDAGGYILAQSMESAECDGMPSAAQNTGICDAIVLPDQIPDLLLDYYQTQILPLDNYGTELDDEAIQKISTTIQRTYSINFSKYKEATIARRVVRRMEYNGISDLAAYVEKLDESKEELDALYGDLLIGVTEFFRDPKTFSYLKASVLPKVFQNATEEGVRCWVAGCSTGEEAYTLAIILKELAEVYKYKGKLTIFATDAYGPALMKASAGIYSADKLNNVSQDILSRYFSYDGEDRYSVSKELRSMVVFAQHNLLNDAPFTRMDFVSCRNLLIYLKSEAHSQSVALLNFALRPGGILLLGSSEGVGRLSSTFSTVSGTHKVYTKTREARPMLEFSGPRKSVPYHTAMPMWSAPSKTTVPLDRQLLNDYDLLLTKYLPPSLLVDEGGHVLHFFGDVSSFLRRPEGRAENNILKIVDNELYVAVSLALQRAKNSASAVRVPGICLLNNDLEAAHKVDVVVEALADEKTQTAHFHIQFVQADSPVMDAPQPHTFSTEMHPNSELQSRLFELENELIITQQNLQLMADEAQNSREELLAANEELQSTNEELQSTNEELRSLNEELSTVNAESEKNNQELVHLNRDLAQLLGNLDVGVLFLDGNLRIRKFNPSSAELFRLLPQDIGRPIDHLAYYLVDAEHFIDDLKLVLKKGEPVDREIQTKDGAWYLKQLSPYFDDQSNVTGVVVSLSNVSQLKAEKNRAEQYLNTAQVILLALDNHGDITMINRSGCQLLKYQEQELVHKNWFELCLPESNREEGLATYHALSSGELADNEYHESPVLTRDGELRDIVWHHSLMRNDEGRVVGVLSSGLDVTKEKRAQEELRLSEMRFRGIFEQAAVGVALILSETGEFVRINQRYCDILGYDIEEMQSGKTLSEITHPEDLQLDLDNMSCLLAGKINEFTTEKRYIHKQGDIVWVNLTVSMVEQVNHSPTMHIAVVEDITARKQAEDDLRASEERFRTLTELSPIGIFIMDTEGDCTYVNERWCEMVELTERQALGDGWFNAVHPKDNEMVRSAWNNLMSNGGTWDGEFRLLDSSGKTSWVYGITKPVLNPMGEIESYLGVSLDISGRKKAERQIQTLSQAIEQSPVLILITDVDARIEYVNAAFEKVTGYSLEEVKGKNPRILKSGLTSDNVYNSMWKSLKEGKAWSGELNNRRKNGETYWEHAHIAPVLGADGEVQSYLGVKEDITEKKEQEDRILFQAHYDALTELPNRFLTLDRLEQLIREADRLKQQVAVLFLDLDDFKKINDTMGHDIGDKLLLQASSRLRGAVREGDVVGRLGGDEFIILLGNIAKPTEARHVAEALLERFQTPFCHAGREFVLTASMGISIYPNDGANPAELLRNADAAMYHSKEQGRNTYHYFTESMNKGISQRLRIEECLRNALERKELHLKYQPLVDISTGKLCGVEALLRWENELLGTVPPDDFISIAENTGLILPIGRYVLTEAIERLAQWITLKKTFINMSVNLSPRQLRDPELVSFIDQCVKSHGIDCGHLQLEITEGVLMGGHAFVDQAIKDITRLGIKVAMDDFGTGYSSLSYLRNYPFNTLKIDRSFVKGISINPADRELVNAAIAMAHGLSLNVVAEGVETLDQLVHLKANGCDIVQGYFLGKPMTWQELLELPETLM